MIELKNIDVTFQNGSHEFKAVDNVSLKINKGEIFGIVGPSGAGKSTLVRVINLLQRPTNGEVIIEGSDITKFNRKQLRKTRLNIGMIFQHFNLISGSTIAENVAFSLYANNYPKDKIKDRVKELLEIVHLPEKADAYPANLSGGQKQRVAIARALANNPDILLCDEATSALDIENTEEIVELLREINEKTHITIVFITHEMDVAKKLFDRIAFMEDGKLKEVTDIYSAFANPKSDIAKSLVQRVLNVEVPEGLKAKTNEEILRLSYTGDDSYDPVISVASKNYDITMDIINGKVDYIRNKPFGMLIVILRGEDAERKKALEYIKNANTKIPTITVPYLKIIQSEFAQASFETFEMVLISMIAAAILGTILGLVLHLASNPIFYKNRVVNGITGTIINVIRSLPFIILIIVLQPLARLVVGTSIGPIAASVSLAIAAIAFYARLVEGAFSEVDKGVIEAAVATGASMPLIIRKVLFVEATPALVRALTVTFVSVIGYSAMAGAVGGGGIGNLAIMYGYNRYQTGVLLVTVVALVIIVQVGQWIGDKIALKLTRK